LRDTLLRAAAEGFYQVYWSAQILDEAQRNLVENSVMSDEKAAPIADRDGGSLSRSDGD